MYARMIEFASAVPQNVGVVSLVMRSVNVAGLPSTPLSLSGCKPSVTTPGNPSATGGAWVSTMISNDTLRGPKPVCWGADGSTICTRADRKWLPSDRATGKVNRYRPGDPATASAKPTGICGFVAGCPGVGPSSKIATR